MRKSSSDTAAIQIDEVSSVHQPITTYWIWRAGGDPGFVSPPSVALDCWGRLRRSVQVGELAVPLYGAIPDPLPGASLVPDIRAGNPFTSIKEFAPSAKVFLTALARLVSSYQQQGTQWVVGRSSGGIDPAKLGLPGGTVSINEAVAVVFALASRGVGNLLSTHADSFVLLADLGGGFLDVSVADNLKIAARNGTATIVNFGGYPLGVDRISKRFVRTQINNPKPLIEIVALAIEYHLWDYLNRPNAKTKGLVYLCGGGFERLGRQDVESIIKARLKRRSSVDVHFVDLHFD